jgi:hypothetical protein
MAELPPIPAWVNTVTGPNLVDEGGNTVGRQPNLKIVGATVTSDPVNLQNVVDVSGNARGSVITVASEPSLPNSRRLVAGQGISLGDGGAGGTLTVSSTTGWQTALDIDFTSQSTQAFSSDGTYTVGGLTWSALNTAAAGTFKVSGTVGLIISNHGNAVGYSTAGGPSSPLLRIPFANVPALAGTIDWDTRVRVWVRIGPGESNNGGGAAGSFSFFSIDNWGSGFSNALQAIFERGLTSGGGEGFAYELDNDGHQLQLTDFDSIASTWPTFTSLDRVFAFDVSKLMMPPLSFAYSGSNGPGTPFPATTNAFAPGGYAAGTTSMLFTGSLQQANNLGLSLGISAQSTVTVQTVIQRLKIEYRT